MSVREKSSAQQAEADDQLHERDQDRLSGRMRLGGDGF